MALLAKLLLQPHTGIQVQMVGGLIQQQHEGLQEQSSGDEEHTNKTLLLGGLPPPKNNSQTAFANEKHPFTLRSY